MRSTPTAILERQCSQFNATYPVGTRVRYYPTRGDAACITSRTRSEAFVLCNHTAVVMLEGKAGCVALDHVVPVETDQQALAEASQA